MRYPMLRHIFADLGYPGPKQRYPLNTIGRGIFRSSNVPIPPRGSKSYRAAGH